MTIRISKHNYDIINEDVGAGAMGGGGSGAGMAPLMPGGSAYGPERPGDCRMPPGCTYSVKKRKRKLNESDEVESAAEVLILIRDREAFDEFLKQNPDWEDAAGYVNGIKFADRMANG